jgi:carbon storage regulator
MLVLSRKIGQRITIGEEVSITVLGLSRGQVRLGIDAPSEVPVLREELYRALRAENVASSQALRQARKIGRALRRWQKRGRRDEERG